MLYYLEVAIEVEKGKGLVSRVVSADGELYTYRTPKNACFTQEEALARRRHFYPNHHYRLVPAQTEHLE